MSEPRKQIEKKAHEIVEQELIRIRQSPQQIAPSFDDVHKIVSKVLGLIADCVCIEKEELTELFDNHPSSCCDVHSAEPMEYENWICMLREKLLGDKKK